MAYDKNNTKDQVTIDSIKLSAKKHKLIVIILSLMVFSIAGGWAWVSTRQFYAQTIAKNQEHLLDIARIESMFLKNLLLRKADYSLEGSAHNITVGEKGYIWIIDENGKMLSHPDKDQVGKDKMAIRKAAFPDHDWSELDSIVEKMKKGQEGVGIYQSAWWTEDDPEVSKKLVGFASVQVGNRIWSVAACMSFEEIVGPIQDNMLRTFGITGLAVLLFGVTSRTFYISQKRENEALQREVLDHKKTKGALEKAHGILEQRVEKRTAELKKSNEQLVKEVEERTYAEQQILKTHDAVLGSIGRDLHDGLLQQLTGVTYYCDTLAEELTEVSSPCIANAREISDHLRQLITSLRDLAKGLYPTDWDANGLAPALEILASTTSHLFKTSVIFNCNEPIEISDSQVALHLYRIAQEAVNNAVKHGNAKYICISLVHSGDTITLAIEDNGSEFSPTDPTEGMGLQSIAFRAKAINGIIDIKSGNGKGTIVSCSFLKRKT